ncbi:hypothetical protein YC2023_116879 [Brassica napus]
MRLRRDSKLEPGTCRDPVLVLASNYATTVSMVLYSLRGVFWDPSCASFRSDESKSFFAPGGWVYDCPPSSGKMLGDFCVQAIYAQFYGIIGGKRLVIVVLSPA